MPLTRRLDWPDCWNTRDLGGLPRQGGVTSPGVLVRSDSVGHLTEAGLEAMVAYGVATVIDLRTDAELAGAAADPRFRPPQPDARARAAGVVYLHLPLVQDVKRRIAGTTTGVGRYIEIVDTRPAAFATVFNAIAGADGTLLFHCFAGKDRTGIVAAMLLELAGVDRDVIGADYGETDTCLAPQYELWLAEAAPDAREEIRSDLTCPPGRILGVLDHLDAKWGGVASYLEASGVPQANLDVLESKLRQPGFSAF